MRKYPQCFVVAVESSYINVDFAAFDGVHDSATRDIFIDQSANVFVFAVTLAPELLKRGQGSAGHAESAPNPIRRRTGRLHLDFIDSPLLVTADCVKQMRALDFEEQE